jgi:hypothetical protein
MKKTVHSRLAYMLTGVLIGAAVFGGGAAIAAGITALPTTSKVFVNGEEIKAEAYNIHDNNFFMLRDIAAAVDFSVVWDGGNDRILIDTGRGYDPDEQYAPDMQPVSEAGASVVDRLTVGPATSWYTKGYMYEVTVTGDAIPGKLANGADVTDANILAMLAEVEAIFPEDTSWGAKASGNDTYYYGSENPVSNGGGCNGFAGIVCDVLYGHGAAYSTHNDLSTVKCGDIVRLYNESTDKEHWIVVIAINSDSAGLLKFTSCEGNVNGRVKWNFSNPIGYTESLYPDSTIYSFK